MELRNLVTFVKIVENGSFTRTAESLGYSQSAVTMQIKQLESELGTPLFERIGKKIRLTAAGEKLFPYAAQTAELAGEAFRAVTDVDGEGGTLRLGTAESYVIGILPRVFAALAETCPKAEISVSTGSVDELTEKLRRNETDAIFFLDRRIYDPDWIKAIETPVRIHFVASVKNPLASERGISLARLSEEPLFLTEKGVSYRYAMEQTLAEKGFSLHPFLEIGNTDVITRFVSENRGISFLPEYVVGPLVKKGELAVLDTECPEIVMWSQFVVHRNKRMTPLLKKFIELAKTE